MTTTKDLFIVRWVKKPYETDIWQNIIGQFDVIPTDPRRWGDMQWIRTCTEIVGKIERVKRWAGNPRFGQPLWNIVAKAKRLCHEIQWFYEPIRAAGGSGLFFIVDVADGRNVIGPKIPARPIPREEAEK